MPRSFILVDDALVADTTKVFLSILVSVALPFADELDPVSHSSAFV